MAALVKSNSPEGGSKLQQAFTRFLLESGALRFGDFTLKSGRRSPYFINAGAFNDGQKIALLGEFYAQRILQGMEQGQLPGQVDTVFGPAYKGIPLAVSTSIALSCTHAHPLGYTFDRKEPKDHGDGGSLVGTQLEDGMRVLLVDDVMTAGTAVRECVPKILAAAKVQIVGLVLSVDRMEVANDSGQSAVESVMDEFGFPVLSIANIAQVFAAASTMADAQGKLMMDEELAGRAQAYLDQYGA
ncbi:orotate phosphoribosyltransferase [Bombiscardovia nodaiensis]|uniref:Orotate phosphoribosyltransferase n=1 Tax=Bombiscardovia nodaiensis TaxID=2932181 RepID=A0ABM8B877_9BIFI|nr:orotate phosphoribosyltransferase [Bombiscardovia nodaiensis]